MDEINNAVENGNNYEIYTTHPDEPVRSRFKKEPHNFTKDLIEWLDVLCVAIIAVIVVFSFAFRIATIDGDSMLNTLHNGDRVIISNFNYTPKQGDIVVVSRNAENTLESEITSDAPIIKRVIAVGGQTVDIDFQKGIVYVDGLEQHEPYLGSPTITAGDVKFPLEVPEGHVFILGDNRCNSLDSRFSQIGNNGIVDNRYILGRAIYRFFPFDDMGELTNYEQ